MIQELHSKQELNDIYCCRSPTELFPKGPWSKTSTGFKMKWFVKSRVMYLPLSDLVTGFYLRGTSCLIKSRKMKTVLSRLKATPGWWYRRREINYASPSLVVICVCYKTVNQEKVIERCYFSRKLHAKRPAAPHRGSVQRVVRQGPRSSLATSDPRAVCHVALGHCSVHLGALKGCSYVHHCGCRPDLVSCVMAGGGGGRGGGGGALSAHWDTWGCN